MLAVLMAVLPGKDRVGADEDARLLEELHRRYAGVVYNKCVRMLRDRQEAEDAVEDGHKLPLSIARDTPSIWDFILAFRVCPLKSFVHRIIRP